MERISRKRVGKKKKLSTGREKSRVKRDKRDGTGVLELTGPLFWRIN